MLDDFWALPWELRLMAICLFIALGLVALAYVLPERAGRHHGPAAQSDKPAGQDRLTRISRTGMDAQDRDWDEPDSPLAQAAPPPLRRGDPPLVHPETTDFRALRPPVPPAQPLPAPPAPFPPPPQRETRAQRRERLEALIQRDADRRRQQDPETP